MTPPFIPYGRQIVDQEDIDAVVDVLRGDWLTTGPAVGAFEEAFAAHAHAAHAVAVANGTAALHLSVIAAEIGPGDEVIVPALTFAASANCVRYAGGTVVFADVREDTLTVDTDAVAALITPRTKAIVAVDYGGMPCDLDELVALADRHGLTLIEDASHAPGAEYRGRAVGGIADLTTFSFHPVKHLTTGEGGMVTTDDAALAQRLRRLRNHGIDSDHRQREELGTWAYDMVELGFNYRLADINCALGTSQLAHLPEWLKIRRELVARYDAALRDQAWCRTQHEPTDRRSAWHLYPLRVVADDAAALRRTMFDVLRANGVGVNVHYVPVYLHTYYRRLGYGPGLCPIAERAYDGLLSLPMWPGLSTDDQDRVIGLVADAAGGGNA